MTIGIVGLGLIGGSLAAAFKRSNHKVLGCDTNEKIQGFAKMAGSIDDVLDNNNASECDFVFLAVTPRSAISWLEAAPNLSKDTIVIDCCGTKRKICQVGFELARKEGFHFVGGHPMAGKQVGGYKNSSANLFDGAFFAIVMDEERGDRSNVNIMMRVKSILKDAGFTEVAVMSPEDHDKIIAFTSQMAHLISNAYIKSRMAEVGVGTELSGGAFRDMTRVAYLDPGMWTELFLENKDNLLSELTDFIAELEKYKSAIENGDEDALEMLLLEGKNRKQEIEKMHKGSSNQKDCGDSQDCVECKLMH